MQFKNWLESSGLGAVLSKATEKHPGVQISAYENKHNIELMQIKVPEDARGGGIGTEIIKAIQEYARSAGKPIVIRPAAEKGRKGDLERFYKGLGFVHNRGRNVDFTLSSPTASTMYWRPQGHSEHVVRENQLDELESFYQDNEQKVLRDVKVQEQLKTLFNVDDPLIRKILGVGSEDGRGNYFVRTFNQRHGDWNRHLRLPSRINYPEPEKPVVQAIPKEIVSWFAGSKITEKDGSPKIVYHGTDEKFDKFEAGEFGFHFGDEDAASMMGDAQKFLLRITKPLRLRDLGTWEPERVLQAIRMKFEIPDKVVSKTLRDVRKLGGNPDLDQDEDMVLNRKAHYAWSRPVRELISHLGFDGIIYRNEAEGFSDSYIAFDSEQIRKLP
jgi:predicted GNAT family acetyltransferase